MGAIFEREGIAVAEPLLKAPAEKNGGNAFGSAGQGRWRIPLGAYQSLMTLLSSDRKNWVEGIPVEQLRAATLGRERTEKKFPTVRMLIRREVSPVVASALAPYQRGGVDFILDKEGRVLLADEMGLGELLAGGNIMRLVFAEMDFEWFLCLLVCCYSDVVLVLMVVLWLRAK